jgi:hypothetical protein
MIFRRYPFRHASCCRFAPGRKRAVTTPHLQSERGLPGSGSWAWTLAKKYHHEHRTSQRWPYFPKDIAITRIFYSNSHRHLHRHIRSCRIRFLDIVWRDVCPARNHVAHAGPFGAVRISCYSSARSGVDILSQYAQDHMDIHGVHGYMDDHVDCDPHAFHRCRSSPASPISDCFCIRIFDSTSACDDHRNEIQNKMLTSACT